MITLFTTTKDFNGINRQNQLNAIRCWLSSPFNPEVIVFGKTKGIEEIDFHPNLKIVDQVNTTTSGVPFANEMFDVISKIAKYPICCYLNADILLTNKFFETVSFLHNKIRKKYLIVGERIDFDINEEISFNKGWEKSFMDKYKPYFKNHPPYGSDFFVFPKGQYTLDTMPELLIGRPGWDNIMIYNARKRKFKTIDISDTVKVFHQNHHQVYSTSHDHPDNMVNFRHLPDSSRFTLIACNYIFSKKRLRKNKARRDKIKYEEIELALGNISFTYRVKFYYKKLLKYFK
jgi:hypothetical protein